MRNKLKKESESDDEREKRKEEDGNKVVSKLFSGKEKCNNH